MTKKSTAVVATSEPDLSAMTVAEALSAGLIYIKSDMPLTNGDLSRRVESLVRDTKMSYADIVATIKKEFPHARTSTKSVASVACVMRKKGINVPLRLKLNIVD